MTCCRRLHRVVLAGYDEAGGGKGHMRLSKYGLEAVTVKETDHYRITRGFATIRCGSLRQRSAE